MLCVNLTTVIGLGEIFLIVCQLLMSATGIPSKLNIINQLVVFQPENGTMEDNSTACVFVLNSKTTTKKFLKRTFRKKRHFLDKVKIGCGISINSIASTCTPFFIHRSKMTHRKTTRLKDPIDSITDQTDMLSTSETFLQKQDKKQIRKFLFSKHTSTSVLPMNSSEFLKDISKNRYKTTNTPNLLESLSEENMDTNSVMGLSSEGFNITPNKNRVTYNAPISTKKTRRTTKLKTCLPSTETSENRATFVPVVTESSDSGNFDDFDSGTQNTPIIESHVDSPDLINKTSNPPNTSRSKIDCIFKKLKLSKIFHSSTALPFAPSEKRKSDKMLLTFEAEGELEHHNTLAVTHPRTSEITENDNMRDHKVTKIEVADTSSPKNMLKSKMFHIHHSQNYLFSKRFTTKMKELSSVESTLKQTADTLETQIPSSISQHMKYKEDHGSESNQQSVSNITPTRSDRKYVQFLNMLHMQHKPTLANVLESSQHGEDDSDLVLRSSVVNHSTSQSNNEPKIIKEESVNTHSMFENTDSNSNEVLYQTSTESPDESMSDSTDRSNNKKENTAIPIAHNPFKIKYLMRFRNPMTSTPSADNNGTTQSLRHDKTHDNDKDGFQHERENTAHFGISTKPMDKQDSLNTDLTASNKLYNNPIQHKLNKNQHREKTTILQDIYSINEQTSTDSTKFQSDENTFCKINSGRTKDSMKIKGTIGLEKHKKNKKHKLNISKSINSDNSRNQMCCYNSSTEENAHKDKLNITVHKKKSRRFREWFVGKTTKQARNKVHKNEKECTFRWCVHTGFNTNASSTKPGFLISSTSNKTTDGFEKCTATYSSVTPEKKLKHFFHFRTSNLQAYECSTVATVPDYDIKELSKNTKLIFKSNFTTKKCDKKYKTSQNNGIHSRNNKSRSTSHPVPVDFALTKNISTNKYQRTLETNLNSLGTLEPNVTTKDYRNGKVKEFLNVFHTGKPHFSNKTLNVKYIGNTNKSSKIGNGTVIFNPEYADYVETKGAAKKHKKYSNRTVLHNASDVNDTSFNVMAFVMKPFDSLVSVFKALSPNSVTKIGDVNATDVKNGSLPNHLQPLNSSIVILAVNNTNATSKDVHDSKLEIALDLLGGMYHCVFNSFIEAKPEDVHFYLYTRSSPEEPEELFLPPETSVDNETDVPLPVLEKEATSESPVDKREIEYDEEYEFEALNPAKSEIQSKLFNVRAETKILIHGYLQDYQTDIMVSMREAYLSRGPYNVVVVDWSVLVGDSSCYPVVAARGLRQVGSLLAQLLDRLAEAGVSFGSIHVVGFSLGAHVAGHAGTFVNHGLISRITGLDPALPYVPMEPHVSLDSDDAMFVDIIHSAAGLLGQSGPMGHVDFYPNGGSQQPGCERSSLSCSHRRAALYFIESINSDRGFQATKCESWHHFQAGNCSFTATAVMGEPCHANTSGKYYLVTGYKSPYAIQPEEKIKVKKSLLLDMFYDSDDL